MLGVETPLFLGKRSFILHFLHCQLDTQVKSSMLSSAITGKFLHLQKQKFDGELKKLL
jgi:hypothetical protein